MLVIKHLEIHEAENEVIELQHNVRVMGNCHRTRKANRKKLNLEKCAWNHVKSTFSMFKTGKGTRKREFHCSEQMVQR